MKLSHLNTLCLFALPAALAIACGSSSSPSTGGGTTSTDSVALSGTYVPVGSTASKAEFASITFSSATNYAYVKANCTSSCTSSGTYTFDGDTNLNLTDGTTSTKEHVDFQATKVSSGTSLTQSTHVLDGLVSGTGSGSGLVNMGSSLTSGDGSSLIQQILQALMNGIMMALQGAGGDGGSGDDDSTTPTGDDAGPAGCGIAIAEICVAAGGSFTSGSDGSCTCTLPDAAAAPVDAGMDASDADAGM